MHERTPRLAAPSSFFRYVAEPVMGPARWLLLVLVLPLVASYFHPMWTIRMEAPQYPDGLVVEIYSHKLEAGNEGHDIQEINTLNHYIGMRPITREELRDLDWMPFAIGALILMALRVAAIGDVRSLIDLAVANLYVAGVAFGRFVHTLYGFGHDLDPRAPVTIEPFTPAIIGSKQVANFLTHSLPAAGGWMLVAFTAGVWVILLAHLVSGWRRASAS